MARQVNSEQLQQQVANLTNRLEEANRDLANFKRELLSAELLKNRYYNAHVQIASYGGLILPSKAMRSISEEALYGEEKAV
jgi:hypothetical protein